MTSRPIEQCLTKLEQRRKRLQDGSFTNNYLATQHALADLRDDTEKVKDIREYMDEIKESKGHTRDFENAESELMLMEDLYHQKKRCLETTLYVSEIENIFQNVQSDIEERAIYLTTRRPVFDSVYRGEDIESQSRLHKDCVYAVRESWSWLKQISFCMENHMENAASFHQFHHDVKHLEEDLATFLSWMDSPTVRAPAKTKDPNVLLDHFRLLVNRLLDYQNRVNRLTARSREVHPIPYRKELPNWPVRARVLVKYSHKYVSLEQGDFVSVLDNEDPEKWQIRTTNGQETEVPGIILVIPPPDPACFQEINKLREQMHVHHRATSKKLRSHLIQFLSSMVAGTESKDMQGLSSKQKSDFMKLPNDVTHILQDPSTNDPEFAKLKSDLTSFRKLISQIKPGPKTAKTATVQQWNTTASIVRLFEELQIYADAFETENEVKQEEEKLLIQELTCPPTFCSKAYFERVTPMIDIDTLSKEAKMTSFKSEIYIHERHKGGAVSSGGIRKQEAAKLSSAAPNQDFPDGRKTQTPYKSTSDTTDKFIISGVVDPKTNQKLSLTQALAKGILNPESGTYNNLETGKSIPITEAIALGLIDVEYADALSNGHLEDGEVLQNSMETKTFDITGVVDPRTGETISIKEAMAAGLIDPRTGKFFNPITKEEMPLMEAIRMGYLMADPSILDGDDNVDSPMYQSYTSIVLEDTKFQVSGVRDPTTGSEISLKRAIKDGIVDPVLGIYKNPVTGETMSIEEALKQGLIKGHEFDPRRDREGDDTLTFQQLKVRKQTFKAGEAALLNGEVAKLDPSDVLLDKLRDNLNTSEVMVTDPKTGKPISLEEAIANNVIDLTDASFRTASGETIPLQEAASQGYLDPTALKAILSAYEDCSLGQLINSGQFDPETGLVTDPVTGKTMTLQAAIESGVIDPEAVFFYDVHENKINSLAKAMESGRLDKASGKIKIPGSSQSLSIKQAEEKGQIMADINPKEISESIESLAMLKECMDTSMRGIKVPQMSELASVEEAVTLKALNIPKAAYADENTVGVVPLQLAVQMEKVEPDVALALFSTFDKHSLQQEMDRGVLDPKSGKYVNPHTNDELSVDDAKRQGLWNPNYVYLVDEETGNVTSLGAMVDQGKFNPDSGKYMSDSTGQDLSIHKAIEQGLITPTIEAAKFVDMSAPLKDLIDSGKVNPRSTDFVAGDGLRMSLRDGLANGFLTMGSKVKLDPETGDVYLVSNDGVVESLIGVKENSEWLLDIERTLASQGRPSEKLSRLKQQAEDCQGLKHELERKKEDMKSVINEAEWLVQNNTGKDQDRDESAQQFQKLRSSTADLKVRLDSVDTEVENRRGKLTMMSRNLEELYFHLEEFDQWLDTAIEKSQDLQGMGQDLEAQHFAFKEFMEEVKDKDEDMSTLVKTADEFKDTAQDVEKEMDVFRKRLEILPTFQEETERGVLDEELESIEAKFKDISKDCGKHMERLSSLVKHKKAFDDLHEKLSHTYPDLQARLSELAGEEFGMDPGNNADEREALKAIKADLIGQERKLKDLLSAGERLANGYTESGMHEDAEEIKAMVALKQEEHRGLTEEIADNEQLLDAVLAEQQNVFGRLEGIEAGLEEAEKFMKTESEISLDRDILAHQLEEQRLLSAEISSSHALLERLSEDANGSDDAEQKVGELLNQAESLENLAGARSQLMEEVQNSLGEIDGKAGQLDSWLAEAIRMLKPKGGAPKPTRAKVDNLHENKKEKEAEMRELRNLCEALLQKENMKDEYALKETLGDVETKWNDVTELLVQQVSLEALSEIDGMLKYLDKAENEINTAEPISMDPETLSVQLRDHKSFNDDLKNKRNAVKDIIDKCTQMLRETANSQTDEIKARLDSINTQAEVVCQLSAERLQHLEAALPLATHYGENQTEVGAWLDEMEAELNAQGEPGDNLEQVKKQHDHLKTTQLIIEDHKLFIDDLNSTGLELMDVCSEGDAVEIQNKLLDINKRYEGLKSKARGKARDLMDAKKKYTQETSDSLDHLLDDLNGLRMTVSSADSIPASPDKLKNEIDENKAVLEDLERQKGAVNKAEEVGKNPKAHGIEDSGDAEDVKQKVALITEMAKEVKTDAMARDKALNSALKLSDKFYDLSTDVMSGLRDLKDSLCNQEPPGVDPDTIKEQQGELAGLKKELEKARELVGECKHIGADLCDVCGEPGAVEVQKQLEDLGHMIDEVNDTIRDRGDELRKAFQHADQFKKLLETINTWLPIAEHKLACMHPPATNPDALQKQMDELRMFKAEVHPHIVEMQQLNQEMTALRNSSPIAAEALQRPVKHANEKWSELLKGITERETKLTDTQLKVGEVNGAMEDVIVALDNLQPELEALNEAKGDPKCLETHMRKLQLMQADIRGKEKASRKLNKAVDEILQHSKPDQAHSALQEKREEMNGKIRATQATAKEKENKLQDAMRQIKKFLGDLDDQLAQVVDFRNELKTNQPFGALPDTSEKQYAEFVKKCQKLDNMEKTVEALLAAGQEIIKKNEPQDVTEVSDRTKRLRERWTDTRERARKRKEKMEEHLRNVSEFHNTLKAFTDWLNGAEMGMRNFKYPSKLVDRVTKQIQEHEVMRKDLENQASKMNALDRTGTYLKYFGRKQDTVYVKNLLVGIRLRWKKLLRRTDERGRLLQQAYKEDKRFDDSWRDLCEWLDESFQMLSKFMNPTNQATGMKQDIDELKRFNHQLTAKHPTFYSATRLGRNLKDRCTKNDPEREVLHGMLEQLKSKWNSIRSVVSKSQNKLDEALLTSGRVSDALQSLLEWLQKAESTLDAEMPVLGDLDTIHMLIEQHRNIQQELAAREATVLTMKAPGNLPPVQSEDLSALWDRVNHLSDIREVKLKEGLKLAEEFQEVVTVMREFLPQAEAQLKFRALPEDEMVILQLIEKHEKFQEELRNHQECVDRIKGLAEEILLNCHPNAIRFVKYYLTITQTRWDQLLQRAKVRGDRLQEALRNIQGNAALLEELLAWLTDAQALLATKERDPIPEDLKVVETLLKEHLEFHEEVTSKNNDAERLSKLVTTESKMAAQGKGFGSNMKLNEFDGYNPRVIALQNKWRTVWRMSVDRKKLLQDAHDTLLELESFKNFDFDLWRQRYLNWIQAKKFRITDFFRRQDKDSDGFLDREEFVSGMLKSKFPTNRTELNAVFDIFDEKRRGLIEYKNFVDALKSDRRNRSKNNNRKSKSDMELIHEEIEKELSACSCRNPFRAEWLDEGKYRFGEKQKTCLVRFLNHTVMVRVGGGWVTLEEFVEQNDPCKAKGRTNMELRDTLALPDGTSSVHSGTSTRRGSSGRTSPFPTGVRRRQNDTGYASSNSSGSNDSSLRRSRITSSMVNLASPGPSQGYSSSSNLSRNADFGSTGNLNRSKRLSNSSTNISGRKTPTPSSSRLRSHIITPRSTTPTVAFGSSVRSRPTTPTFSPHTTSTPQRPGSVTPTKGLGSAPTRQRRLPSTPTSSSQGFR